MNMVRGSDYPYTVNTFFSLPILLSCIGLDQGVVWACTHHNATTMISVRHTITVARQEQNSQTIIPALNFDDLFDLSCRSTQLCNLNRYACDTSMVGMLSLNVVQDQCSGAGITAQNLIKFGVTRGCSWVHIFAPISYISSPFDVYLDCMCSYLPSVIMYQQYYCLLYKIIASYIYTID